MKDLESGPGTVPNETEVSRVVLCVCFHFLLYVCRVCMCVHVCVHMCGGLRLMLGSILNWSFTFFIEAWAQAQSLHTVSLGEKS